MARAIRRQAPPSVKARANALRTTIARAVAADAEEIELLPIADDPRSAASLVEAAPPAPAAPDAQPSWRVNDRSPAGWRISAPGGVGQGLALGALVALSSADGNEWMLGTVSRIAKGAHNRIEAGMSLIASRVVPVTLYGRRKAQVEMSFVVDGIDMSTRGPRFDGLYLMPPIAPRHATRDAHADHSHIRVFRGPPRDPVDAPLESCRDARPHHRSADGLDLGDDAGLGQGGAGVIGTTRCAGPLLPGARG